MAYSPQTWTNQDVLSPLSSARLNFMEQGIAAASTPVSIAISVTSASIVAGITNAGVGTALSVTATDGSVGAQGAFFKTFAGSGTAHVHAVTAYTTGSGNGFSSALNVVSDNAAASAVQVTGSETGRGSVKIAHVGQGDGSDANASGVSIDLQTAGTAAQGIFIDSTTGGTTGKLLNIRNNGNAILQVTPKATDFTTALETHNSQARFSDGVATKTNAGAVTDGTFSNGVADGLMALDLTNFIFYTRMGGNWYGHAAAGSATYTPADQGMVTWTTDPGIRIGSAAPTAGVLILGKMWVRTPVTVSTLWLNVSTGGSGATSLANCFVGLYNSSGVQVGFNATDQATSWASSANKPITLTATTTGSLNLVPGFYWSGILVGTQSTTPVALMSSSAGAAPNNIGLTNATYRTCVNGTSLTALPGSFTPASNTQTGFNGFFWTGLA